MVDPDNQPKGAAGYEFEVDLQPEGEPTEGNADQTVQSADADQVESADHPLVGFDILTADHAGQDDDIAHTPTDDADGKVETGARTPYDPGLSRYMAAIAQRIEQHGHLLTSPEQVRLTIAQPLIDALGFDVANPTEVVPRKEGEDGRPDYAITIEGGSHLHVVIGPEVGGIIAQLDENDVAMLIDRYVVSVFVPGSDEPIGRIDLLGAQPEWVHALTKSTWDPQWMRSRIGHDIRQAMRLRIMEEIGGPSREFVDFLVGRLSSEDSISVDRHVVIEELLAMAPRS